LTAAGINDNLINQSSY